MNATQIVQISTGVTVLTLSLLIAVLAMLGQEGMYMLGRRFRRGGLDVLRYNRLSRSLKPTTIRWNGRLWEDGKAAKYFGLDVLKDPAKASGQQYSRGLQEAAQWAGCKRPVLLANDSLCFVYNVGFAALLDKKEAAPEEVKKVLEWLQKHWAEGYTAVDVMKPIPHDELAQYLNASTPDELSDAYDTAYGDGVRDATKPRKGLLVSPMQIAIGAGAILAVVILVILVQRGAIKIPDLPILRAVLSLCARA